MNRFVIGDPKDCIGCNTCMAACSEVHKAFGLQSFPRLQVMRNDDITVPILCRHCDDAPCATVCPVHAITHKNDSIQLNESLCIGCKLCGIACPFGAITQHGSGPIDAPTHYENFSFEQSVARDVRLAPDNTNVHNMLAWQPGVKAVAIKCDLCYFRPEGPACVQTCPTKTLFVISDESIAQANQHKREMAMVNSPAIPR
ncbi:4Fe-4S dicluster domain-containing protein [Bisgaard Taxon 10/6]|uniref:4Fe-4S dicluster domain-containing protein n=1 Tax=Exercitatus varius TaxID=67857 RepID=A0ABT6EQG6_9PAST|nr:4Fe-4S dicluster domain-containing protein [Exercitatus varius]QOF68405.1 4Fe-4S dicluster domain-containing protein [Actinobacillus sp. GY-402]MDG2914545.1 4Fe-4S dicluster domain-containing protein [Exercitatus varius]MDG2939042.1 4Fe-4S dicluster domain-containing protein [Exercitatus varius]MDG2945761.1 4Fe-4S dicluster domain-containing protein [Exercitatus varius]MDG2962926.1 4Fe-4S dicluster domain-containing protein [Exercitatus varius]